MTPYERHAALAHKMTRHSPNGVDIVEECAAPDCGMRFLHNPCIGYPVTLYDGHPWGRFPTLAQWAERTGNTVKETSTGGKCVIMGSLSTGRADLWNLSDYGVSSVSGPVVYLWNRAERAAKGNE